MDNSDSVGGTIETVDTVIFRAISEIRGKSSQMKQEFIILLKTFLIIVAYPMVPLGKK